MERGCQAQKPCNSLSLFKLPKIHRFFVKEIRKDIFDQLDLPLEIKRGVINSFCINIPWTSLSNKSIEIEIGSLITCQTLIITN